MMLYHFWGINSKSSGQGGGPLTGAPVKDVFIETRIRREVEWETLRLVHRMLLLDLDLALEF